MKDIETLVISNGNSGEIWLSCDDWWKVYSIYKQPGRDLSDKTLFV